MANIEVNLLKQNFLQIDRLVHFSLPIYVWFIISTHRRSYSANVIQKGGGETGSKEIKLAKFLIYP